RVVNMVSSPCRTRACIRTRPHASLVAPKFRLLLFFDWRVVKMDQFPGISATDPHFRGLKGEGAVSSRGPVCLGYKRDIVVKAELLRVNLAGNDFRLRGSVADLVQLLLFA